jgi:hypothetical protein
MFSRTECSASRRSKVMPSGTGVRRRAPAEHVVFGVFEATVGEAHRLLRAGGRSPHLASFRQVPGRAGRASCM